MRARVDSGVWAVAHGGDLHLGMLKGDIEHGWAGSFGTIPGSSLTTVAHRLNTGGFWSDGDMTLAAGADGALITLPDNVLLRLDHEAAARLQIVCSLVAVDHQPATIPVVGPSAVTSTSRGLMVSEARGIGECLGLGAVDADRDGHVVVLVPTTAGPLSLRVPALPVLVAAAEAGRLGEHMEIQIDSGDGPGMQVVVSAEMAQQAAAEAQWLLPAFGRRFGDHARER